MGFALDARCGKRKADSTEEKSLLFHLLGLCDLNVSPTNSTARNGCAIPYGGHPSKAKAQGAL